MHSLVMLNFFVQLSLNQQRQRLLQIRLHHYGRGRRRHRHHHYRKMIMRSTTTMLLLEYQQIVWVIYPKYHVHRLRVVHVTKNVGKNN